MNTQGIIGKSVRIRCSPRYCNADEIVDNHWPRAGKGQKVN